LFLATGEMIGRLIELGVKTHCSRLSSGGWRLAAGGWRLAADR
jgi:hypothetical protein